MNTLELTLASGARISDRGAVEAPGTLRRLPMSGRRLKLAVRLALLGLAALPASAAADDPADQPPFGGERPPALVEPGSRTAPPPGFELSAAEAIAAAGDDDVVGAELAETPAAAPAALIRGARWQVEYRDGADRLVAVAIVDGDTGEVDEAYRDQQVGTPLARGYEGAVAQKVNAPYVWITLCVLLVAPFFDRRRPLRLVHVDLLVLLGLGLSLLFFNRAEITASVALTYPVLGYFLVRMLIAGLRPPQRGGPGGPLVPLLTGRTLMLGVVALAIARIVLNLVDSQVIDIGLAGVVGAERIGHGEALYDGTFSTIVGLRGDVYGPANYLAYLPFELALPWSGTWDGVPAAHAAAIAFDLACVAGLVSLGRRLRSGGEGSALGWALGFAWLACPWTLYAMNANANDSLIAALGIGALLALRSAPARGAMVALAAAAKFGSAALAPLFATVDPDPSRRRRGALVFSAAFVAVVALCVAPFAGADLGGFYDRTLGYQASRSSPFSVWGQAPSLDALQPLARLAAVALALAVAFVPRRKAPIQVAALAAAVTIAVQLTATHWFYFYVVWFLPFVLVASFGAHRRVLRGPLS